MLSKDMKDQIDWLVSQGDHYVAAKDHSQVDKIVDTLVALGLQSKEIEGYIITSCFGTWGWVDMVIDGIVSESK